MIKQTLNRNESKCAGQHTAITAGLLQNKPNNAKCLLQNKGELKNTFYIINKSYG
jgi:hypothetical protein